MKTSRLFETIVSQTLTRFLPVLLAFPCLALAETDRESLKRALTLHASFDNGVDADFARGDRRLYTYSNAEERAKGGVPGLPGADVKRVKGAGRFKDALLFTKKSPVRPFFKGPELLNYNGSRWSTTVSVWLRLSPDIDLEPGYCDPVQIVGDSTDKGFIFLEWSKDHAPRHFRFAILPIKSLYNPHNTPWEQLPVEKRPMIQVERAPFSRAVWTHVVFTCENVNDKVASPKGLLFIDGKPQGAIENWDLTLGWQVDKVLLVLGASYVGHLDELAVFDRALTEEEVVLLHRLETGVRALY